MPTDAPTQGESTGGGLRDTNRLMGSATKGHVRVRSNVCTDPKAWHLVPGDELRRHSLHYGNITRKQHEELMYYEPCCICKRRIYEIREDGCDHPICRKHGKTLSTADAARRKRSYVEKA